MDLSLRFGILKVQSILERPVRHGLGHAGLHLFILFFLLREYVDDDWKGCKALISKPMEHDHDRSFF